MNLNKSSICVSVCYWYWIKIELRPAYVYFKKKRDVTKRNERECEQVHSDLRKKKRIYAAAATANKKKNGAQNLQEIWSWWMINGCKQEIRV